MIKPKITKAAISPHRLFLYGNPKVGKTSSVALLPNHLIIDTEVKGTIDGELMGGSSYCEGALSIVVDSLAMLKETLDYLSENPQHDYVIIDTIDHIEAWVSEAICKIHKVNHIGDIDHGKGWSLMRTQVISIVEKFAQASNRIIIIGHQKDGHSDDEIQVEKINLTGKLKTHLCSIMDGIGRLSRDTAKDGSPLMVDFRASVNSDAGCRIPTLAGRILELKWETIYPELKNK
jgi:hypothetical protein